MSRQEKRFWSKVQKTRTCWLWTGAKSRNGYGSLRFNGKHQKAHRVAWELRNGPIPKGEFGFELLEVVHKCRVRSCVRPSHLSLVPHGLSRVGRPQKSGRSRGRPRKLEAEQVATIRALAPAHTYTELAALFGVSPSTISAIARGRTWRVEGTPIQPPRRSHTYREMPWPLRLAKLQMERAEVLRRKFIPAIGAGSPRFL